MANFNLDPKKPDAIIACISCHKHLWHMKYLKIHEGNPVSMEYERLAPEVPRHSDQNIECPFCGSPYMQPMKGGQFRIRLVDPVSGAARLF